MGELSFGKSFNLIEGENRHLPVLMEDTADYSNFNGYALAWFFLGLTKLLLPKLDAARTAFLNFVIPYIDKRMKMENAKKDFFHHLIDAKDPDTGEGFSLPELWGETTVLMVVSTLISNASLNSGLGLDGAISGSLGCLLETLGHPIRK
jgi:hypothetical protein